MLKEAIMATLKDIAAKLAAPVADKVMGTEAAKAPNMGRLVEILGERGEMGKLTHLAALQAIAELAIATDSAPPKPSLENAEPAEPEAPRSFLDNVRGVFSDFTNVLSERPPSIDSMDGKGYRLQEALPYLLEHAPEALAQLLREGVDYRKMVENPLDPNLGSPVEIGVILAMHRPGRWASFQDWKDRAFDMPELRRVAKEQSLLVAGLVAVVALVALTVMAPELLWKLVSGAVAPLKWVLKHLLGGALIGGTILLALWGVEDLFYGWGAAKAATFAASWAFITRLETGTEMNATAMAVGFGLLFIARVLTGQVDAYLFGHPPEPTTATQRPLISKIRGLWSGLGWDALPEIPASASPDEAKLLREQREEAELRNLENFTFSKVRRPAVTIMLVVCILQIVFMGRWLLLYGGEVGLAAWFTWSGGLLVTWLGAMVELTARFPTLFQAKEKREMILKAFGKIERWGLMPAAVSAVLVFGAGTLLAGLTVLWVAFSSTQVGQLATDTTVYTVQVASDGLSDVAVRNGYVRSDSGTYTRRVVTNPGQGQTVGVRPETSVRPSGPRPALCAKPENAGLFVCK